ncbi:MAG: NifU family protein [Bacteroides sp.]|nr:NifU family protein [Bacteroides sp.]
MQDSLVERVEKVISERIRPLLHADGGDVRIEKVRDDGIIIISFTGYCAGCPGSEYTVSSLIEPLLRKEIPEIRAVRLVPWHLP